MVLQVLSSRKNHKYLARSVMTTIHGIGIDTRRKDLDYDLLQKLCREARQVQPCYFGD